MTSPDNLNKSNAITSSILNGDGHTVPRIRIPAYMPNEPALWFTLVENAFTAHRVTDDTLKVAEVTAALPAEVLVSLAEVLRSTNADKFVRLREKVLLM